MNKSEDRVIDSMTMLRIYKRFDLIDAVLSQMSAGLPKTVQTEKNIRFCSSFMRSILYLTNGSHTRFILVED